MPIFQRKVRFEDPKTFAEAVKIAKKIEVVEQNMRGIAVNSVNHELTNKVGTLIARFYELKKLLDNQNHPNQFKNFENSGTNFKTQDTPN